VSRDNMHNEKVQEEETRKEEEKGRKRNSSRIRCNKTHPHLPATYLQAHTSRFLVCGGNNVGRPKKMG